MSIATLSDIFFAIVDRAHERVMMHRQAIQWVPISSQELYRQVAGVSQALERWGIGKGASLFSSPARLDAFGIIRFEIAPCHLQ